MRIGFNARTLAAPQTRGWSRYASNLIRELSWLDLELFLFTDRDLNKSFLQFANKDRINIHQQKGLSYIDWEQRVLPLMCLKYKVDVLHCPTNYGLPILKKWKQVLSIHDAIDLAFASHRSLSPKHLYIHGLHKLSQVAADKIITVSKHAKSDLIKYYGIDENKIEVIYEAADPIFSTHSNQVIQSQLSAPYLFYVGGFEDRKNVEFLIRAFAKIKNKVLHLVLAGGGYRTHLEHLVYELNLGDRVQFLGWVPDEQLVTIYKNAKAFIYPSLYEGFGLQIVEAMAMGCPTLCSNRTSLPEIYGLTEAIFNPTNELELTQLIDKLEEQQFYLKLQNWTKKRSQDFSWLHTAKATLQLYSKLIDRV